MGGEPRAVLVSDDREFFFQPLVLRPIPSPRARADERDAISPYGYAGPLISAGWNDAALDEALATALSTLADASVCCAFIRLDPLGEYPISALARHGDVKAQGQSAWCDLTRSDADLAAAMGSQTRSMLRRAARDGLSESIDDWSSFPEFTKLYAATMDRLEADSWYQFGDDYFDALRAELGGALHLCTVRDPDRSVVAAGLFTACCDTVQYHLSGRSSGSGPAAVRFMLAAMQQWAKASGYRRLHLGGGLGGREDSLFAFKASIAPDRGVMRSWAIVSDAAAYARLCEGLDDGEGFFPAYRAPVAP